MKSTSAKTFFVFAAAMALGAAATVSACTVTTTSNPNFDGGSSSGSTSSGGTSDGGEGGTITTACQGNTKQSVFFEPQACQTCFDTKCCGELNACFGITPDGGAGAVDCNAYATCIDQCTTTKPAGQERDDCYALCDDATQQDIRTAYDNMANCGNTNCKTECGF